MDNQKCPFCNEPCVRQSQQGNTFRCGTRGPDDNGEYATGHTCDITTYSRLIAAYDESMVEKNKTIERLQAELLTAIKLLRARPWEATRELSWGWSEERQEMEYLWKRKWVGTTLAEAIRCITADEAKGAT